VELNILEKKQNIIGFKRIRKELREAEHDLGERVKELNCLHGISQLVERPEVSFEDVIRGTLELIPLAWQFPEVTCVRITYDKKLYKTENFKETEWKLTTRVEVSEKPMEIEVYYIEDNPFLKEEINLITDIGKHLKIILKQMEAEQKLKDTEEKFRKQNVFLNNIIESLPHPFLVINVRDYTIELANSMVYSEDFDGDLLCYSLAHNRKKPCEYPCVCPLTEMIKTKKSCIVEHVHYDKEGNARFYEIQGYPLLDEDGNVVQLIEHAIDITERKKMEEKSLINEESFRDFFDNAAIGFHIFRPDRIIADMNNYELNLLGYSREEIVDKKTWYDLIIPEQRRQFDTHWNDVLDKNSVNNLEYTLIHKDGHFIDVLLNASSRFDEGGNLVNTRGSVIDITGRRKVEQALRVSEHNLGERIKELNFLYGISQLVERPEVLFEDIIRGTLELIPPAWQFPKVTCARITYDKKLYKTENFKETEWKLTTRVEVNEKQMEIEVNYLEDNPFLKEEINLINDLGKRLKIIIEQMEAEQKLKESEEKLKKLNLELEQRIEERTKDLKESEQRYRELYEDAPNAYFTINPDKSIKSCNQAAVELLGYSKEEFQNIKFFYLYYNSPEDLQKTKRLFKQFLKGKNNQDVEIQMKHKNGNPIWVSLAVKPVRNQKGQVIESRTIVRNITERKRTEELIIEENKKLAELNKIKKNLIIRVSHELKTPLNSMYGAIHILMNFYRDRMDKEILEFNNIIYKGCIRLKKLIEDLMDISKLDHSKIILKKKEENISNTLMGCVSEIKHMATQRNLNLIIDLPKVLFIDFDKIRIEQVFINILSNAIKFTPPSGSIFIYLKENSKNIEISVKDTGIGLTRDEMKYLFKRFGKIERYGKQMEVEIEGSGLGLYIAKQIIELHGGDIIVESEGRNKGSTFTIILYK
jgi:PAS domain S-box-containing protein